jgi:hypothetical protein
MPTVHSQLSKEFTRGASFLDEANHLRTAETDKPTKTPSQPSSMLLVSPPPKSFASRSDSSSVSSDDDDDDSFRMKDLKEALTVTPSPNAKQLNTSLLSDDDDSVTLQETKEETFKIVKSDHKRAEEAGFHKPEPLLVENPNRFVLFPIQDNDVSEKK